MEKHAICFLVDQVTPDVFYKLMDEGVGPHVRKYILGEKLENGGYSKASISRRSITGYPSTSANSHVTLMTGSYAGRTHVLDTCYWVLEGNKPRYRDTSSITLSTLKNLNEKYLNPACPILFDYVKESASFHAIHRGATYKLMTLGAIITKFLPWIIKLKRRVRDYTKPGPFGEPAFWKHIFTDNLEKFLIMAKEGKKLPGITYIVFLLTDENGHRFGFQSSQYREAIGVLDYFVRCLVEGFEGKKGRVPGLKDLGLLDSIIWCLCTDHASRLVNREKMIPVNLTIEWDLGLRLIEGREQEREHLLEKMKWRPDRVNGLVQVDGASWHCWMGNPEDPGAGWSSFFSFHDTEFFRHLRPMRSPPQAAVGVNKDGTVDLISYLLSRDSTNMVVIPVPSGDANVAATDSVSDVTSGDVGWPGTRDPYNIRFIAKTGAATVSREFKDGEWWFSYKIDEGKCPLEYLDGEGKIKIKQGKNNDLGDEFSSTAIVGTNGSPGKAMPASWWLEVTACTLYPDAFFRMFGFFDYVHAPNFVLLSDPAFQYYSLEEPDFKGAFKNLRSHGGLWHEESIVPLTFAGPGIKKGHVIPQNRNVDVVPTVLAAIGADFDSRDFDGVVLDVLERDPA